jgi:hypothetical protein
MTPNNGRRIKSQTSAKNDGYALRIASADEARGQAQRIK